VREPLDDAALAAAQEDLDEQASAVEGLAAVQVLSTEEGDLVVLVFGDDEAALERTREQLGNSFMRKHVIPHADGPPSGQSPRSSSVISARLPRRAPL
jgi:hypothetical protein